MHKENEVVTRKVLREELNIDRGIFREEIKKQFNDFAVIVNCAFSIQQKYMDKKFDAIDERFEKVETKLDGIQSQVNGTNNRLLNLL